MKRIIRRFFPKRLWKWCRKQAILREHRKTSKVCNVLLKRLDNGSIIHYPFTPKKKLEGTHIIWQYWAQGYEQVPELVRICLNSVERYKGDYEVIRLTDANLKEYVDFPDSFFRKREKFGMAFFSDLLRMVLLSMYGGVWLDATVLLTGTLPDKLAMNQFFMFQRDDAERNKNYWEGTYAYYWGWYSGFKVRVLNSIIFATPHCTLISDMADMLYTFWLEEEDKLSYFFFQILFHEYISFYPPRNCVIESDCIPHYIMQILTDNYSQLSLNEILDLTNIHKLTYKIPESCLEKLKIIQQTVVAYADRDV